MPAAEVLRPTETADDLALLVDVAREAGRIAMRYFRRSPEVWMKGGTSPVSEADYAVDKFLRETLLDARPDYGWLSEETTDDPAARRDRRRLFIVDPIDGTRGFLEGGDRWCVSVAVVEEGTPVAGALECPVRRETFSARLGQGAFKNGRRLSIELPADELRIAGPDSLFRAMPQDIRQRARHIPRIPSLACRVAMIADGSLDASFVRPNAHDWDLAAADLILREAGGMILDERGGQLTYGGAEIRHGMLVAGSGALLSALSPIIARDA